MMPLCGLSSPAPEPASCIRFSTPPSIAPERASDLKVAGLLVDFQALAARMEGLRLGLDEAHVGGQDEAPPIAMTGATVSASLCSSSESFASGKQSLYRRNQRLVSFGPAYTK